MLGRRTPGEYMSDLQHDYARPLVFTAVSTLALIGFWSNTDKDKIVEPGVKMFIETVTDPFGINLPWEDDNNKRESPQQAGTLVLDTYLGSFANYTEARTSLNTKVFGQEISESHTLREGIVVSRLRMPGVPTLTWKADDDVKYLTRYENGTDVGLSLTNATFEMQNPDIATMHDGEYNCLLDLDDVAYSGCVEADTIRVGYFAGFPGIGEDPGRDLQVAGEMVFDEFAKIEACHFDNVFIPLINKVYEDNGITKRIDGPGRYTETMKTFIRYFLRAQLADDDPAQRVFVKFEEGTQYIPAPPIRQRFDEKAKEVNFPFALGDDIENNYCQQTSTGLIPITFPGEPNLEQAFVKIALGGLEQVPEGFNIKTGQFEQEAFAGANLDTSLGEAIKNILGGS